MSRIPWDGVFADHPVRPAAATDPLPAAPASRAALPAGVPRIGYAALWEKARERTWSGSAWNLREGLRQASDTVDIGVEFPAVTSTALKALHARYSAGRLTSPWFYSAVTDSFIDRSLRRGLREQSRGGAVDAVLLVEFLTATVRAPCYVYADCSWDSLFATVARPEMYADIMALSPASMMRRRDRQLALYERAAGIITMSRWFAKSLVEQSGISPGKVHVAYPGFSVSRAAQSPSAQSPAAPDRPGPRRKLLFVGRQSTPYAFYRKGGDLVVAALAILRRDYDPGITLTVAGPERWPLPGPVPDGVHLLGPRSAPEVARLYDEHDLFVMPSRQESFGIVFLEALSRGLPCVARNAYAMPEVVTPGISGALIERDDPGELAQAIISVLEDDDLYRQCLTRAPRIADYFSWERTGRDVAGFIAGRLPAGGTGSAASGAVPVQPPPAAAAAWARCRTSVTMSRVTRPVNVFCWLGW